MTRIDAQMIVSWRCDGLLAKADDIRELINSYPQMLPLTGMAEADLKLAGKVIQELLERSQQAALVETKV